MRHLLILSILMIPFLGINAQSKLTGLWENEDKNAHVKIVEEGSMHQGKLAWLKDKKGQDKVGTHIFIDLKPKGKGWEGKVYSIKRDATHSATFVLKGEGDIMEMTVSTGMMSRTQTWTRVKE